MIKEAEPEWWDMKWKCHDCRHFGNDIQCKANYCEEWKNGNHEKAVLTLFWKKDGSKNI